MDLVRHGGFTRAARAIRVAQPVLSAAVRKLEVWASTVAGDQGDERVTVRWLREVGVEPRCAAALAVLWLSVPAEGHEARVAQRREVLVLAKRRLSAEGVFEVVIALLLAGAGLTALSRRIGTPYPAMVALAGAALRSFPARRRSSSSPTSRSRCSSRPCFSTQHSTRWRATSVPTGGPAPGSPWARSR